MVATFIRHDDRRIVFKRTGDERTGGLIVMGFGALFASMPIYWLCQAAPRDPYRIPILILLASIGILISGWGWSLILASEWLVIDLSRRTYKGRRGLPFWRERFEGPLDDFEEIRIVDVPWEHDPNQRQWAVAWIWKDQLHEPFIARYWKRPRSFHLTRPWTQDDRLSFVRTLKGMAKCTGLPLGVPRAYLDHIGVFDLSGDV
jgi:hypothetical protein